ncbi:MAG: DUF4105 domain-containing protein [Flavobacteriaceae bacterium]
MKKTVLLLFAILGITITVAQNNQLSNKAKISVLTIGPGISLNDAFGHSAFRINDPVKGLDLVFNYGVYDFEAPNFYLKFTQGKLNYLLGLNYYEDFYHAYITQNRSIQEQILNLSEAEKQKLYDYLLNNYKPENRGYLYDFFFDNCATKIKDVTQIALNNDVEFNVPKNFKPETFRSLIYKNVNKNTWGSLGIDLALGSVIDQKATPEDYMFLPENIYTFFKQATINPDNRALVKTEKTLFSKIEKPITHSFFTSPLFIFGLIGLFIIYKTYSDFKKQTRTKWLDVALFVFTGLIGIGLLLLWFATDHKATHQNYNLLWAFALNLFVVGQLLKTKPSNWFVKYLKLLIILLCLLTLHWLIGVQVFAVGLIPWLIALFIRYVFLVNYYKVV